MEVEHSHIKKRAIIIGSIATLCVGLAILTIILIATNAAKKDQTVSKQKPATTKMSEESQVIEKGGLLVQTQFMFAKRDTAANKTEIYRRPPGGDISEKVLEVPGLIERNKYSRLGSNIAFSVGSDVYASNDEGVSFRKIYSAPIQEEITSLRFSKQKPYIALAVTRAYGANTGTNAGNQVLSMKIDGSEQKKIFTTSDVGVFIKDWSVDVSKVLYQSGCNRCDQASRTTALYDTKTKKTLKLPIQDGDAIGNLAMNDAGTKIIYSEALHDPVVRLYDSIKDGYYGPPYSIHRYTIEGKKDHTVARMGKRVAKPQSLNDIPAQPIIATAGTTYGRQQYYYYNNVITILYDDNSTKKLITMPSATQELLYVSEGQVLAILQKDTGGWDLVTIDPSNNARQTLFTADASMIPLGMSDQF